MQTVADAEVTAIASRDVSRARAAADALSIPQSHGSYEELLANPRVDAVYIPLPNHLHVDWSIRALEAGKHVLCEKPIGLDATDAMRLVEAAANHPGQKVMEAFMYRFHPQWERVYHLLRSGTIGALRAAQFRFCYHNDNPHDIRNQVEVGGGALMDIGCYPVSIARWLFGRQPDRVFAHQEIDARLGTDILTSGVLEFAPPAGREEAAAVDSGTASFVCSTQLPRHQHACLLGTKGRIELPWPFNPEPGQTSQFSLFDAEDQVTRVEFSPCDQYALQVQQLNRAIREAGQVPTPLADAVDNMRVIDALVSSRETDAWITVE